MALTLGRLRREKSLVAVRRLDRPHRRGRTALREAAAATGRRAQRRDQQWEWCTPKAYLHDEISTDKRNPRVNANGPIYGSPEESTDMVPVLDPCATKHGEVQASLSRSQYAFVARTCRHGHSAYWGDEPIWDGHTSVHNPMFDEKGRVWFTARIRAGGQSGVLQGGIGSSFGEVVPLKNPAASSRCTIRRPGKWLRWSTPASARSTLVRRRCQQHAVDQQPAAASGVVGWLNTKMYDQTRRREKSQGWTPLDPRHQRQRQARRLRRADQPLDPTKDKRIKAASMALSPSPVDGSIWGTILGFPADRRA